MCLTPPPAPSLSQRSVQVPVLVPLLSNALFVDVLDAVHRVLLPLGYQALIGVTHYDPQEEEQLLRTYLAHRPAGLLVTGFDRTENARQMIAASGVPKCAPDGSDGCCRCVLRRLFAASMRATPWPSICCNAAIAIIAFAAAQLDPRTLQRAEAPPALPEKCGRVRRQVGNPQPRALVHKPGGHAVSKKSCAPARRWTPSSSATMTWPRAACWRPSGWALLCPRKWRLPASTTWRGSDQMVPPLTTVRTPRAAMGEAGANMLLALMRGHPQRTTA